MQIQAIVRPTPEGAYRATFLDISAEGPTVEEAAEALRDRLRALLDSGARVVDFILDEPGAGPRPGPADAPEDEPWFDRWRASIAADRRQDRGEPAAP